MCVWTEIILWSFSPMKVLEMYSDTWLPERLISDRWDSSLFSILLNCSAKQKYRTAMYYLSALWWYHSRIFYGLNNDFTVANEKQCLLNKLWWKTTQIILHTFMDVVKIQVILLYHIFILFMMRWYYPAICMLVRMVGLVLRTLLEAISLTERCVWMVSNWSKHQSSSSSVSRASCWYCWSESDALGLTHTPPMGDLLRTQHSVGLTRNYWSRLTTS